MCDSMSKGSHHCRHSYSQKLANAYRSGVSILSTLSLLNCALALPLLAPLGLSKARHRRCSLITISLIPSDGRKYSCVERDSSRIERGSPRVELGFSCIERGVLGRVHLLAFCPRHWRRIVESQLISRCVRVYHPFLHARDCILRIRG